MIEKLFQGCQIIERKTHLSIITHFLSFEIILRSSIFITGKESFILHLNYQIKLLILINSLRFDNDKLPFIENDLGEFVKVDVFTKKSVKNN